ncbi:TPA: hypothetical protein ACOVJJ_004959 [Klebsiella oxytoca]
MGKIKYCCFLTDIALLLTGLTTFVLAETPVIRQSVGMGAYEMAYCHSQNVLASVHQPETE